MSKRTARIKSRVRSSGRIGEASQYNQPAGSSGAAENQISVEQQYQYVKRDLTRIGVIAALLIGGLVVLSYFIR